ncbi:hypothetical protein C0991_001132 [Blastosporella zonata]|nr:hypothetical protein C0991_001132 [Blastosporella zonata]
MPPADSRLPPFPLYQPAPSTIIAHNIPDPFIIHPYRGQGPMQGHPTSTASSSDSDVKLIHVPPDTSLIIYGSRTEDSGEEIRFTVELTRLNLLEGTYSLDVRRLKGNLRSYKFLYDALRDRADLQREA